MRFLAYYLILLSVIIQPADCASLKWAREASNKTLKDVWGTWRDYYATLNLTLTEKEFLRAAANGVYEDLSLERFLALNIENHRLKRYPQAQSAKEIYPPHDPPRGSQDLDSVNYFLHTTGFISPVIIARVKGPSSPLRLIKLDGVHRLAAALIRKSPIRILWMDVPAIPHNGKED